MNQLKPYSEYKDSGQPWLGRVPAHWMLKRAKLLYREVDERSATGEETLCSVSHKTGVTPRKANVTMFMAESTVGYKICRPDDLVINTLWAWMAALGIAREVGVVSPAYGVYRPHPSSTLNPAYADSLLRTEQYKQEYISRSTGVNASRLRLYPEQFLRIPILLPPPAEQAAIVRFLEALDRRVNRFVRAKRRLIELLTEQKQALITHAVTRGLNSNANRKPSGIDWLGDVPEHWEVLPLRRRCKVIDCKHVTVEFVPDGIPLASVREVQSFDLRLSEAKRTTPEWFATLIEGDRQPRIGDIVYCRNVSVGAAAVVNSGDVCAMGQDVCLIRSQENARFLNYYLQSGAMKRQLSTVLVGSTFDRINVAEVKGLIAVFPPKGEQAAIAKHLDGAFGTIEGAVTKAEREIALIREYRTRLVADVVTGKLDVRAAAVRLPADEPETTGAEEEAMESAGEDTLDDAGDAAEELADAEA